MVYSQAFVVAMLSSRQIVADHAVVVASLSLRLSPHASLLEPSPGTLKTFSTRPSCPSTVRPLAGRPLLPQHSPLLAAMDKALLWSYKWPLGSTEKGGVLLLFGVEEKSNFLKEKGRLWFIFGGCWQSREVKKKVTEVGNTYTRREKEKD